MIFGSISFEALDAAAKAIFNARLDSGGTGNIGAWEAVDESVRNEFRHQAVACISAAMRTDTADGQLTRSEK
jgi:hypothetical protein